MDKTECEHIWTQGREGQNGLWCGNCGVKVFEVDERGCGGCEHYRRLFDGSICKKHLMGVTKTMHVTYKISEGSCWRPANPTQEDLQSGQPAHACNR